MEDIKFIKLSDEVQIPSFNFSPSLEFFVKYGDDNQLPAQLLGWYKSVGLHRAIIQKKTNLFMGEGIIFDIEEDTQTKNTIKFLENPNEFENFESLLRKIGTDWFMFGGSYLQVVWNKAGTKINKVYHMPYEKMRVGGINKYNQIESFWYNPSNDKMYQWNKYTTKTDLIEFPAFSTAKNKGKSQILYMKNYEPSNIFYSLPDYIGAIKDLDTLAGISDFHNANIHNNMQPGFTVIFKGPEPDEEAKDAIVKQIKNKYTDTTNAGKPMVFFISEENSIDVSPMEASDIDKMYEALSNDVKENIIVSHQIPRAVASLAQPGALGNTKEIIEALEMMKTSYISPNQDQVLKTINALFKINKLKEIEIMNAPTSLLRYDLSDLEPFLTQDEVREYLGYQPIVDEVKKDVVEEGMEDGENDVVIDNETKE